MDDRLYHLVLGVVICMKKWLVIALLSLFSVSAFADGWGDLLKWRELGERSVSRHNERDTIHVSAFKGRYDRIAIKVEDAPVRINRMTIFFGDGRRQDFFLNQRFARGQRSRIFDLIGGNRIVNKVEFSYKTAWGTSPYRYGTVILYGRKD